MAGRVFTYMMHKSSAALVLHIYLMTHFEVSTCFSHFSNFLHGHMSAEAVLGFVSVMERSRYFKSDIRCIT